MPELRAACLSRRSSPSRCMRQDTSTPVITSAPARTWSAMRSSPMSAGDRLLVHREGPAEAAALVGSRRAPPAGSPPATGAGAPHLVERGHDRSLPLPEAELAQAVAALVQPDPVRETAGRRARPSARRPGTRTARRSRPAPPRSRAWPRDQVRGSGCAPWRCSSPRGRPRTSYPLEDVRGSGGPAGAASAAKPALAMGCPQQVCASGNYDLAARAARAARTVASPTSG